MGPAKVVPASTPAQLLVEPRTHEHFLELVDRSRLIWPLPVTEPAYGAEGAARQAEAVTPFEQTIPGLFERVTLQTVTCDYATFAIGNLDDDQAPDLVPGSFRSFDFSPLDSVKRRGEQAEAVWIWKNLAARRSVE